MVVSSAYLTIEVSNCLGVQSLVYIVNREGLNSQKQGFDGISVSLLLLI